MDRKQPYRRRNYFIKKHFQTKFALRFAVLILVEAALIAALFFLIARGTVTRRTANRSRMRSSSTGPPSTT